MPAKPSVERHDFPHCFSCTSSRVYLYDLGHYFNRQTAFHDATVCCDSWSLTLDLVQFSVFVIGQSPPPHNRASFMLPCLCYTGACSSFINSSPHIDLPIWPKDFELWFVSPLLYCLVFVCLGPQNPFHIVLLPQQWLLDGTSAI